MTRTEHATLSHDGRDVELLAQQTRAEQFNSSTIDECAYCGNDINLSLRDCPARGGAECVSTFAHDDSNHESALTPKEN